MSADDRRPCVVVFAPTPMLTVTIEAANREPATAEIHLHAGGQGLWIARLLAERTSRGGGDAGHRARLLGIECKRETIRRRIPTDTLLVV